jgi:hypothetical protein
MCSAETAGTPPISSKFAKDPNRAVFAFTSSFFELLLYSCPHYASL